VTYPPQPPQGPYGQQYPPPPPPPGYGQQQYPPPNPYPQQPQYGQPPHGQQFGPQFPGGMPPRKPSYAKPLLILLGVLVVSGLAVGGVVWFDTANAQQHTTASTGTSTTHSAPSAGGSGSGGAPSSSPKALAMAFVNAVNTHDADAALTLVCAKDHDTWAKSADGPKSVFNPANSARMEFKSVAQSDSTHAAAKVHTKGTIDGQPHDQDGTLTMLQQNGSWSICSS
jgi:hypothetical protein